MGAGKMVNMFKTGEYVSYKLKKSPDCRTMTGTVLKLHKSGRQGTAEIKPSNGTKKITRKLTHVTSME